MLTSDSVRGATAGKVCDPINATLSMEDNETFLTVPAKDRDFTIEALLWYGLDLTSPSLEHPVDFINRVARLQSRVAGYSWPTDHWPMYVSGLMEAQTGHCGTFNLALVYACKIRGIPARAITGSFASTGLDGHITSEVWIDGIGWMFSDSTCGGVHLDYSIDGWRTGPQYETYFGFHPMDATSQDIADSRALMGDNWCSWIKTVEDRSTGSSNRGYAGEQRNNTSAAYAFDGARFYMRGGSTGVDSLPSDFTAQIYPSELWVGLHKAETGEDISPEVASKNDGNLDTPLFWLKTSFKKLGEN